MSKKREKKYDRGSFLLHYFQLAWLLYDLFIIELFGQTRPSKLNLKFSLSASTILRNLFPFLPQRKRRMLTNAKISEFQQNMYIYQLEKSDSDEQQKKKKEFFRLKPAEFSLVHLMDPSSNRAAHFLSPFFPYRFLSGSRFSRRMFSVRLDFLSSFFSLHIVNMYVPLLEKKPSRLVQLQTRESLLFYDSI